MSKPLEGIRVVEADTLRAALGAGLADGVREAA